MTIRIFCIFRVKSVFLMAAQNWISVRTQIMSKLYEIVIPKKRISKIITFSFVSLPYRFYENQHLDALTCFCFVSVSIYKYVTVCIFIHIKHQKLNSCLYKHKSQCGFLLLIGPEKPEQHKLCLSHWCHDEETTEVQKTFEISSWAISEDR